MCGQPTLTITTITGYTRPSDNLGQLIVPAGFLYLTSCFLRNSCAPQSTAFVTWYLLGSLTGDPGRHPNDIDGQACSCTAASREL
ncbi:hypothetical protein SCLCIDRAFT_1108874 [Scleroderma citrinum Foug A]|uniref:Uncharacterized protein n=1 Tax=Scleroderma citrinum Foug A TaxID=1036808 RepID=A0A0C3ARK7_9AGAM|nr:hypothetical protein SCLCIDRAFT_1108874 [Scleroderma citrinum Foug A]